MICTGEGRYGWLGGFVCPHCGFEYHATIDDIYFTKPKVYIYKRNDQPANALENKVNAGTLAILTENTEK